VHQVVQLHGGSIIAESVAGKGTVFHLFLPLSLEPTSAVAAAEVRFVRSSIASVLMVEQDEAVASGVARLLREEGIAVEVAASGGAALAILATHVPDVVILAVRLPDIDGRLLYEQIAEDHADLAVVFASGSNDEAMLQRYLRRGQVASLAKPYELGALLDVLGTLKITGTLHA
jgi:CheY-like chemotaxis protein